MTCLALCVLRVCIFHTYSLKFACMHHILDTCARHTTHDIRQTTDRMTRAPMQQQQYPSNSKRERERERVRALLGNNVHDGGVQGVARRQALQA